MQYGGASVAVARSATMRGAMRGCGDWDWNQPCATATVHRGGRSWRRLEHRQEGSRFESRPVFFLFSSFPFSGPFSVFPFR